MFAAAQSPVLELVVGGSFITIALSTLKLAMSYGKVAQLLIDHEKRLTRIETTIDGAARGTFNSPRVHTDPI